MSVRRRGAKGATKRSRRRFGSGALGVLLAAGVLGVVAVACPPTRTGSTSEPPHARTKSAPPSDRASEPPPRAEAKPSARGDFAAESFGNEAQREPSPWSSPAACARELESRRAVQSPPARERARIGTWNVRWYPDGRPGKKAGTPGTDIPWLACAMALLDVDVLAVQEFKTLPRARARTDELLAQLDRWTGGRWQAGFDDCPNEATQHTGLLWNAARVTATALRTQGELNPHGEPCKDSLRPGYGAHFRFPSGHSAHVISVHYKSGTERRSHELRRKSFEAMAEATRRAHALVPGADVIFAGDFNTMGCPKCSPRISAQGERAAFGQLLARSELAWAAADLDCSEYYRGDGSLLDGFALSRGASARLRGPAQVSGYCAALACRDDVKTTRISAREALSDHCPVVLELGKE